MQRSFRGAVKAKQRASYTRWPLPVSAVNTTYLYQIASDNTEKVKNVGNKVGPWAPFRTAGPPLICTGFPRISLELFPIFFFLRLTRILLLLLVNVTEVIVKAKIIPVGRAPPVEKHRKPTTGSRLRPVQWRIMPVPLW